MIFRLTHLVPVAAVLFLAFASGCGDSNVETDTLDAVSNDTVGDIALIDVMDDTVPTDRIQQDEMTADTVADVLVDAEPDVEMDVGGDTADAAFTCHEYDEWPSVDNGATKFGLTMFHWNIQYVAGGLIGEFGGETISICDEMTGMGHAECEGWGDDALNDWIIRISFQPILDLYLAHPDWRATFEIPGLMIEAIAERHADILAKLQCAANSGQIELVSFHYSDQLFLPFPSRDLKWSIDYNRKVFDRAALPLSGVVFNQEGQSGLGKHRIMAENGYTVDVLSRNLYRYHQQADTDDGVWPVYESTGPGATQPVKVVVGGGVDPSSGVDVEWMFFDDGEVLAPPGNPYLAMFTTEPDWTQVRKYESELQEKADAGYLHTTITDYVERLEKLGIAPHPLLPIADSTWQPPSTEGLSRWMGRMGTLGYSLKENDNYIRTDNYEASTCLGAVTILADELAAGSIDVTADRETINDGYLDLVRAEVSDATGINPWLGEWVYGFNYNQDAMVKCQAAIDSLLDKAGRDWAIADLDAGVIKAENEMFEPQFQLAPTDEGDIPVEITFTNEGRTVDTVWGDDGRVYLLAVNIGASDNPAGDVREKRTVTMTMPLEGGYLRYSPGLVEDEITETALADFDMLEDQIYVPLANGLIGIGTDLWLVKNCRTVHLAARIFDDEGLWKLEFIDETVPAAGDVTWGFYVLKGTQEEALAFARLINTNPNYRMVASYLPEP